MFSTVLRVRDRVDHLLVTLHGELDLVDAEAVATALIAAADRRPRIVVDLAALRFIDASGMRALARAGRHARQAGGDLLLAAPSPQLLRILAVTDRAHAFSVHVSAEDAASGFRRRLGGARRPPEAGSFSQASWG